MKGDQLSNYPCPQRSWKAGTCGDDYCHSRLTCRLAPIYRRHIALRKAVLGDMPPRVAREIYQGAEQRCERASLYTATERIRAILEWIEDLKP